PLACRSGRAVSPADDGPGSSGGILLARCRRDRSRIDSGILTSPRRRAGMKDALKRVGRVLLWPLRRFFDPRFEGVAGAMNQVVISNAESTAVLGRSIADVQATTEAAA